MYQFLKDSCFDKIEKMKKEIVLISIFFFLLIIAYFTTDQWLDPDFGWHLKTGELILQRGVPKVDWYSFTMPDFPWIDHEWLTDVLIYKIYSFFGFKFLLVLFLAISILAIFLQINFEKFWYSIFLISLGYLSCFFYLGVRPQIITWLFLSILLKILDSFLRKKRQKIIFAFPALFLIWVNLHGGFFVGIFILLLTLFLKGLEREWSLFFSLFIILSLSFVATLINPYGIRIYEEVFRTIGDRNLIFIIAEWSPLPFHVSVFQFLYLGLFLTFFFALLKFKEINLKDLVLPLVFLFFALLHTRHFPLFVIVSLPYFTDFLVKVKNKISPFGKKLLFSHDKISLSILGVLAFLIIFQLYSFLSPKNKGLTYPSPEAISFLKTLPLSENLFNPYEWGGYLIWKIPERRVFIDGRMPSWRKDGKYIVSDYLKIRRREGNFQEILEKYDIKLILLEKEEKKEFKMKGKIGNFLLKENWILEFLLGIKPEKKLYQILIENGWKEIFEDETAIILYKK
jgi:hypothetical protein